MSPFDLHGYLRRIEYSGTPRPDLRSLRALHSQHVGLVPFENLDVQMGRAISLDPEALQEKIVRRRRGGYCFEQNSVFAMALRAIGFDVDTCEARVRLQSGGVVRPRTHMVLRVRVDGRPWLADVGFGADGLIEPLPFDGVQVEQLRVEYRVFSEGEIRVLQRACSTGWEDLYAVLPDAVHPVDFEVANWFTSTYPRSPFVLSLTAQRVVAGERHVLRNLTYSATRGAEVRTRELTRAELVPLLRSTFGLDVPDDATFRSLDR